MHRNSLRLGNVQRNATIDSRVFPHEWTLTRIDTAIDGDNQKRDWKLCGLYSVMFAIFCLETEIPLS